MKLVLLNSLLLRRRSRLRYRPPGGDDGNVSEAAMWIGSICRHLGKGEEETQSQVMSGGRSYFTAFEYRTVRIIPVPDWCVSQYRYGTDAHRLYRYHCWYRYRHAGTGESDHNANALIILTSACCKFCLHSGLECR